ncbi:uncharacterized protein GJ701_009774 [Geothlypis trichas]
MLRCSKWQKHPQNIVQNLCFQERMCCLAQGSSLHSRNQPPRFFDNFTWYTRGNSASGRSTTFSHEWLWSPSCCSHHFISSFYTPGFGIVDTTKVHTKASCLKNVCVLLHLMYMHIQCDCIWKWSIHAKSFPAKRLFACALLNGTTCPQKCSEPQAQSLSGAPGALHVESTKAPRGSHPSFPVGLSVWALRGAALPPELEADGRWGAPCQVWVTGAERQGQPQPDETLLFLPGCHRLKTPEWGHKDRSGTALEQP